MRVANFQSVYEAILKRLGFDPAGDAVTHDTARAICEHMSERVNNVWTMWDWPELTLTEERAYRQVWNATSQYKQLGEDGRPDEVYYIPSAAYYKVKAGGDPPIGQAPSNTAYWDPLTPVMPFVARDQPNKKALGVVRGVYGSDPSLNGCCTQNCLNFRPSEKGITVCDGPATVFVWYVLPPPEYTFVPFIDGKSYAPGNRVFYTGDGNCYRCIGSTSSHPPTDNQFWAMEVLPDTFASYVKCGAYADCKKEGAEDQIALALAQAAEAEADSFIQAEIDDLMAQGQKERYLRRSWPGASWHYDGMVWWPSTLGICQSAGWAGSTVETLTDIPASDWIFTPPPTPAQATMIYRPEIVSLIPPPEPSLKSFPSASLALDTLIVITIGVEQQSWRVDPGPADGADPGQVSPSDYNVVVNNKHYRKVI